MATGSAAALAALTHAYMRPWEVADAWRRRGGRVVGVLGHDLPREIVAAAGALPVRLSPLRLSGEPGSDLGGVPAGLAAQMTPATARVLGALLAGHLDWIDGLAIGRDSEAYVALFTIIRELVRSGAVSGLPPFTLCDLLVTRTRPSSVYNHLRFRAFAQTVGEWVGAPVGAPELAGAVRDRQAVARSLSAIAEGRSAAPPVVTGTQALIAAGAAQILPAPLAVELLDAVDGREDRNASGPLRLFLTGSGIDDPGVYRTLEAAGAVVVGEDHEWGDDGWTAPTATADPFDGIVDRYALGPRGAARSGLQERTTRAAAGARRSGADAVLQVVLRHDEAPPWELTRLRATLPELVVDTVTVDYGSVEPAALAAAVARLREQAAR